MAIECAIRRCPNECQNSFLKVSILPEFLIFKPNLFHSIIVQGKKVFFKKPYFTFISGIFLLCLVLYDILSIGRDCDFSILQMFLYQHDC